MSLSPSRGQEFALDDSPVDSRADTTVELVDTSALTGCSPTPKKPATAAVTGPFTRDLSHISLSPTPCADEESLRLESEPVADLRHSASIPSAAQDEHVFSSVLVPHGGGMPFNADVALSLSPSARSMQGFAADEEYDAGSSLSATPEVSTFPSERQCAESASSRNLAQREESAESPPPSRGTRVSELLALLRNLQRQNGHGSDNEPPIEQWSGEGGALSATSAHSLSVIQDLLKWDRTAPWGLNDSTTPLPPDEQSVYLSDPVFMTAGSIDSLTQRITDDSLSMQDTTQTPTKVPVRAVGSGATPAGGMVSSGFASDSYFCHDVPTARSPQALPSRLDMPRNERCEFCQKHDSMCSRDHRRWNVMKERYREHIALTAYARLPALKQRAMLFLTAAFGTASFATMQLLTLKGTAFTAMHEFVCAETVTDAQRVRQAQLRAAGGVHPLHVAAAYGNVTVFKALLDSPHAQILHSSSGVDPALWLREPLGPALDTHTELLAHLLDACVCELLMNGSSAQAAVMLSSLEQLKPVSVRTKWWRACFDCLRGQYDSCVCACEEVLEEYEKLDAEYQHPLPAAAVQGLISLASSCLTVQASESSRAVSTPPLHPHDRSKSPTSAPTGAASEADAMSLPTGTSSAQRASSSRLPLSVVRSGVLPFCDAESLWKLYDANASPLFRDVVETATHTLPAATFTSVLMRMPGFAMLLDQVRAYPPSSEELTSLPLSAASPLLPLGVLVTGVSGFRFMVVKVTASGRHATGEEIAIQERDSRPRKTIADILYAAVVSSSEESEDEREARRKRKESEHAANVSLARKRELPSNKEVIVSRQFKIYRETHTSDWTLRPVDKWDVDLVATQKLTAFARRQKSV